MGIQTARLVQTQEPEGAVSTEAPRGRVRTDGRFFARDGVRFAFRGVTYGTFRPRDEDGARFPERARIEDDLQAMATAGFTVLRTYTPPPEDLLDAAEEHDLQVMAGAFYPDWRYLQGASSRQARRVAREARTEVRSVARRLAHHPAVLALSLGNEVPADVLRWLGPGVVAEAIRDLADVVRDVDDEVLVTYANYPTAEYLALESLDFLTFNVFLEHEVDLRRYLTRLHHLAGDRPLVLGEVGLSVPEGDDGQEQQADAIDAQLRTAMERGVAGSCLFSWTDEWWVGDAAVEGWHFGLTRADRSPRPALAVAERWNERTVRDLNPDWPSITVVICAYNEQATIDECLRHTCALDYPDLEILVVDDGSTDDTAAIVRRHPRARLVTVPHAGLSVARNEGYRLARGAIVAYLDADAYPAPEWPYYLALGFDGPTVGAVGGPNLPPADDPVGAHVVAQSPGGPVHVLLSDDRAEHVPGCNMAFWAEVLDEVGGFDPIYTSAGDDVDLCWRVLDRGWDIGFHPSALVWHHRRPGLRRYLRQQRGYGRSEALVEARHPDRFTPAGSARWRGHIYDSLAPRPTRQRIYRGVYGAAAYQSIYHGADHRLDVAHQLGVPVALAALLTAPLALLRPLAGLPALLAIAFVVGLGVVDAVRAIPPRGRRRHRLAFRASVAAHHLLQPPARTWGRLTHRRPARRGGAEPPALPGPWHDIGHGVVLGPDDRPRDLLAQALVERMRRQGLRVVSGTGWEDYDARAAMSVLVDGDLVSSAHPVGYVQVRVRPRLRPQRLVLLAVVAAVFAVAFLPVAVAAMVGGVVDAGLGLRRARRLPASLLVRPGSP